MTDPPAHTVDVWLTRPDRVSDPALLQSYERLLDDEERERRARFRFERDRHTYLVSHALVRTSLSRYATVAPSGWRFATAEHGRPELDPRHDLPLRFNLSHTDGLAACAVTAGADVGVDVEATNGRVATLEVAGRFFSPAEAADLRGLEGDDLLRRFFTYWTLKESYIKARGLGLALPLEGFSFDVSGAGPVTISFHGLDDDPADWQFSQQWPTERHSLAVAVRRPGTDLNVRVRETVPPAV